MTVLELMRLLDEYPADMEVLIENGNWDYFPIRAVEQLHQRPTVAQESLVKFIGLKQGNH